MNPTIRFAIVAAALAGVWLVGRVTWPLVTGNLLALKSWTRTEGVVSALSGPAEFEIGQDPDIRRVQVDVDNFLGLSLFKKAPLLVDPADPSRVKPAGLLQMWLLPVALTVLVALYLAIAVMGVSFGRGQSVTQGEEAQGRWIFNPSPGPLANGAVLHSPARQWKIVLGWSVLGVAMALLPMLGGPAKLIQRSYTSSIGVAFTLMLWGYAWHTSTLEVSANDRGIRMTSVLGWRDVPWPMVRSVENQKIYTTYYNGNMRMWEMPFPGSTVDVYAFLDQRGRTLMSFSPELVPPGEKKRLFQLCTAQTGLHLQDRDIAIHY